MDGSIAEAMIVGSTATTSDFNNLFDNMNGANGYNGNLSGAAVAQQTTGTINRGPLRPLLHLRLRCH